MLWVTDGEKEKLFLDFRKLFFKRQALGDGLTDVMSKIISVGH